MIFYSNFCKNNRSKYSYRNNYSNFCKNNRSKYNYRNNYSFLEFKLSYFCTTSQVNDPVSDLFSMEIIFVIIWKYCLLVHKRTRT